jgi:hypothetical protein
MSLEDKVFKIPIIIALVLLEIFQILNYFFGG